jgi:hypothetical protein
LSSSTNDQDASTGDLHDNNEQELAIRHKQQFRMRPNFFEVLG